MKLLSDAIVPDIVAPSTDLWILIGIVAGVMAVTAAAVVLIVVLVKRKKRKNRS